ncbi:MAG: dTDP-glucose 4,6-dehydratase [Rickettsiales bacterium]
MTILVTGGCGFIGSCFILRQILNFNKRVVNLDNITYAANPKNLEQLNHSNKYYFVKGDIADEPLISQILKEFKINTIVNFAAETHVDQSIKQPDKFVHTNVLGVLSLLNASLKLYKTESDIKFINISTDEVYGSLALDSNKKFSSNNKYYPNSPYSASKASGDHLVRAWHQTYGLPVITTQCSNNFGPRQHEEKLIPNTIKKAISGLSIPVYGNGKNVRDWIYVEDHCYGIELAISKGKFGETYCFGGENEINNIDLVKLICDLLDEIRPKETSYRNQITFVSDRQGHDLRYAVDNNKAEQKLGFVIKRQFKEKLAETAQWYLS